jgi:hypothetical protein
MKYALLILLSVFNFACQKKELIETSRMATVDIILTKWKLVEFENGQKIKFETIIEIVKHKEIAGLYVINGRGPVNFFWMNCEIDFNSNSLKMGNINGTEIAVNSENGKIEEDLLQRFSECTLFEYTNNMQSLIFYNTKKTKSLKFNLNKS